MFQPALDLGSVGRAVGLVEHDKDRKLQAKHHRDTEQHIGHEAIGVFASDEIDDEQDCLVS